LQSARERPERELLERIETGDREAVRKFHLLYHRRLAFSDADDAPLRSCR